MGNSHFGSKGKSTFATFSIVVFHIQPDSISLTQPIKGANLKYHLVQYMLASLLLMWEDCIPQTLAKDEKKPTWVGDGCETLLWFQA